MAGYETNTFSKHDDYMTPKSAWENIKHFIPQDKIIWEAFYGDGESGKHLQELGFNVIHEPIDFFNDETLPEYDICLSNPPFSLCKSILERLVKLNKPFIMILPAGKVFTQYFKKIFNNDNPIQLIVPPKRIQFQKLVNGKRPENFKNACNFDCFYYCWKMNLPKDFIHL